jgi:two-component system chemotaxis sensor kinase CheA
VLSDEEIYELIFHPGFSMAHSVTSVSGRGVGMDVVKRQLEAFRGSISIQSAMDQFTRITLEIPLTLAIIEGMLVQVGIDFFIIPLSSVDACIEFKGYEQDSSTREKLITYRERLIPFVKLREAFDIQGDSPDIEQIVITNVKGHELGITVDQVIGGHQTVIKNLGGLYNQVEGISGATILGDGSIALILDLPKLWGIVKNTKVAVRDD